MDNYNKYVLDVFAEHQNCMGMGLDEIQDIIEETPFNRLEKWLTKNGYDLKDMYENDK